ncbi:MAG: hypothetical protein M5U34_21885 [Chloroflexi bacterium]|nr:hypothetical protein [Chloroflexota bacterium]
MSGELPHSPTAHPARRGAPLAKKRPLICPSYSLAWRWRRFYFTCSSI